MGKDNSARIFQAWNATTKWVYLTPEVQNIPLNAEDSHLRPPKPRVPEVYDIFVGISSFRDGVRCGFTLFTAFSRAKHPERVKIGLVDQTQDDDAICVEEYCKLAEAAGWKECKYKNNIRVDARNSKESKGPTLARWHQQQLIRDEEFCLAIDAHSQFLQDWDELIVKEWERTENEMAVLTSYPMDYSFMGPGETLPKHYSSHLCTYNKRHGIPKDVPIIGGYILIDDSEAPQMSALWGGCLSFSKCHAERRAGNDKHMNWVFWGEEYLRSMQLWTRGYDLYSPSRHGHVVFHNWSDDKGQKKRFTDNVTQIMTKEQHDREETLAYNRLRMVLTLPFDGPVDAQEIDKYHGGKVRTLEQYLKFSGISRVDPALDEYRCEQLHWVPYSVPEIIEDLLPGYKMRTPAVKEVVQPNYSGSGVSDNLLREFLANQSTQLELLQKQLAALGGQPAEQLNALRQIHGRLGEITQPHASLLPIAFVWLAMISVWLVYRSRRSYHPVSSIES